MNNGKHVQGTHYHSTKMGADCLAENALNSPKFIYPICLSKAKSSGFQWKKASLGIRSPWFHNSIADRTFLQKRKKNCSIWIGCKSDKLCIMYWYIKILTKFKIQFPACLLYTFFVKKISGGKLGVCTHKNMRLR